MINKINPLYFLALAFVVFLISISATKGKQSQLFKENKNYQSFAIKAEIYKEYKRTWFNENYIREKIDSIIKNSTFKKEKISKVESKNIIKIKIESKNQKILNRFLNKILNERFAIRDMQVRQNSVSVEIGIGT